MADLPDSFDPSSYLRPPVFDVPSGVAVAQSLLSHLPKTGTPAQVKKAAREMEQHRDTLKSVWDAREAGGAADKRPFDAALDLIWGVLHGRLDAYGQLPADRYPKAARAEKLRRALFPEGLVFLTLPYETEWAESQKRIEHITKEGWEADLKTLAGQDFLDELHRAHADYGQILGITKPLAAPSEVNLIDPLRALQRSIGKFLLKLVASIDEHGEAWQGTALAILRVIDTYRDNQARRAASAAAAKDPKEPAPAPKPDPK